jgi:uncharacterized protein (TIGR03437 family)
MSKVRTSFFLFSVLLMVFSGSASSQITTGIVEPPPNYDTMAPPGAGDTYVDPVFGSIIQRVSNALTMTNNASGGNLTWIENEYATMSAFNNDNSKFILLHESYFGLYNSTGTYLSDLPFEISASSEPRWSRKDLVTLYYHSRNQIKSYNIATGNIAVVHTFSEYSTISGNGEMDISFDGDHLVYCGDNEFIFVYQISTNQKFAMFDVGSTIAGPTPFDSIYITPQNNVIVSWFTAGTRRNTGQELFDINMNFLRQVGHADGHKDVTTDTNGDEVLIWTNSDDPQPISNCNNGIMKSRLADAVQTCLAQLDWSLAVHISAPDGNGTVFVDTEAPANPQPGAAGWVAYTDEILQVKLDGSGVTRWAQHRSVSTGNYNWEPKLSTSRDGTRLLYASNFDLPAISGNPVQYADTYLLVLGTASSVSPAPVTPAPVAPAPVVPVSQTIVFAPLSNVVTGVAPVTILATASSGLPVSLASTTTTVCSVSGTTAVIVAAGTCSITASQAGSANYAAAAEITQDFTVNVISPGPAITQSGIVPLSGSSPTIQPGTWASIFGSNLASTTATWNGDFPTSLGDVSVTINGKNAYLSYVSPTQINLQAPDDAATGNVNVTITTGAGSATSTVTLAPIAPTFSLFETGHVAGIILRSNGSGAYGGGTYDILGPTGSSLSYQTVAAKQGDVVELFGVGFGPTSLPAPAGQVFSGADSTTNTVTVSINGTTVAPLFAGLSAAGLYQINIAIPAGLGNGDLTLVATVGSVQTQSGVVISLQ